MEPCTVCEGKRISHTEAEAEKRCNHKKQTVLQDVLWEIKNRHTHTKREIVELAETLKTIFCVLAG